MGIDGRWIVIPEKCHRQWEKHFLVLIIQTRPDQTSLNAAGVQLKAQLDKLIRGCTMTGESHDQLHVFLAGYIPAIKGLANAENYDTARNSAIKTKGNLEVYKRHSK
ncbi:MAG: hypothetical protein ACI8P9_003294 [Parasphingorhabdus sp.]|jgi:hypothetical protein